METFNDNSVMTNTLDNNIALTNTFNNNTTKNNTFKNNTIMTNTTSTSMVHASITRMADEAIQAVEKLLDQVSFTFYTTKQHILQGREK